MTADLTASGLYELAVRRARASRRRRPESCEWPEFAPPVALADGPLGVVQAADREIARQTARRSRAVADFAATRPASEDRRQGEPGAMSAERWAARPEVLREVSEWAAQELVVALSITTQAAEALLHRSLSLVHRLPGTLAALEAGALHPGHLWPMLERVAPIEDAEVRAQVEASLLRWAAGRVTTPAQLGAKARREVLRRDARAAARRLEQAVARRGVSWRPDATDGMGAVTALLTLPEARVFVQALGAYADAVEEDEAAAPRTRAQKMADCLLDLVLRPGESDRPPVQVALTLVAPVSTALGGDEPGEVDGEPVPAEVVRALLRAVTGSALPSPDDRSPAPGQDGVHSDGAGVDDGEEGAETWGAPVTEPPELEWIMREQEDFAAWSDEFERRILAGELEDPDPVIEADLASWSADAESSLLGEEPAHPLVEADVAVPAPDGPLPDAPVPPETPPDGAAGWWARADEAVSAAGRTLLELHRATARAAGLVRVAAAADADDEDHWRTGPGGLVTAAEDAVTALDAATEEERVLLAELLDRTGGGGLADRPRIAITDAVSGALLALTDLPELRRTGSCGAPACRRNPAACTHALTGRPGLGPPGPTAGYRPSVPLDRWVRARDRRCRFPGCRRRVPRGGELDHDRPYPDGPTSAENLTGYCTGHHRGKHQAPGWQHVLGADGSLTVTAPSRLRTVTAPPRYG